MSVIEKFKALAKLAQGIQNIPLYEKLNSFQTEVFELYDQNRTLREKVRVLEEQLALRTKLRFERNLYWLECGDGKDGPYCPKCYDAEQAPRRLLAFRNESIYCCPTCLLAVGNDGTDVNERVRNSLAGSVPALRSKSM